MRPLLTREVHPRLLSAARLEGRVQVKSPRRSVQSGQQDTRLDIPIAGDHQTIAARLERDPVGEFSWPEGEAADLPRVARVGNIQARDRVLRATGLEPEAPGDGRHRTVRRLLPGHG